ncbi:ABC transporter ATP-binding protein [Thiothrix nivea]|uniref:ABC transporter related protein n=1 Tax=Thiothrix nivea (strain ATCC 35100 / DSM 5205 / JP2) TaxID=870187 RepID=A0A656HLV3_THINJ|nr:ABC transporter ATP-binding protein [Thiothrix nivea]EIJ36310.1 ABC transporter related protein [Thiothrix nivea DSM 5205]
MKNATQPVLAVEGISKLYGAGSNRVKALDDVSVTLYPGEVLLIMGPSGSGKTTLLSIMGCILRPTTGNVTVAGKCVSELAESALPDIRRHDLGFVFQAFNLFNTLTAQENVGVVLRLKGAPRRSITARSLALLEQVGLAHRANAYPRDMSGGEKQRTALARALAGDPPILLADEPTANLDSKTGHAVLALLRNLAKETGKAVAIVSHDPKAEAVADRIIEIQDGRLLS